MTREEYYQSKEFKILRLLNQLSFQPAETCQQLNDVLEVLADTFEKAQVCDKFNIVAQQVRILHLEAKRLETVASQLAHFLEPKDIQ